MEIILSEKVENLGNEGDVIKVKDGYARNYLLPRKKAYIATTANLKKIEQQRAKKAEQQAQEKNVAQELANKLSGASCTVSVEVNDLEKMYGSVTEAEIVTALSVEGFSVDKKQIILEKPIEELGIYDIEISLHPEVSTKIRLWVTKK